MEETKLLAEAEDMLQEIFGEEAPNIVLTKGNNRNFICINSHFTKHRKVFLKEVLDKTIHLSSNQQRWKIIDYIVKIQTETLLTKPVEEAVIDKADKSMDTVTKWRGGT
jgi:hypothetical protein